MPSSIGEVRKMKEIIDRRIDDPKIANDLFKELYHEVGQFSPNMSFKISLKMLAYIFDTESGLTDEQKYDKLQEAFNEYYNLPWWSPRKWVIKLIC